MCRYICAFLVCILLSEQGDEPSEIAKEADNNILFHTSTIHVLALEDCMYLEGTRHVRGICICAGLPVIHVLEGIYLAGAPLPYCYYMYR